jgi:hypothetical protein
MFASFHPAIGRLTRMCRVQTDSVLLQVTRSDAMPSFIACGGVERLCGACVPM